MSFIYEPIKEQTFHNDDGFESLINHTKNEEEAIVRIPIQGLIKHGAHFIDDEYFGDSNSGFKLNQNGMRILCSYLGIRLETLDLLEREELATDVLNDLLAQRVIQDKLQSQELIVNEEDNEIIGIVSKSYIGYSNFELLQEVEKLLNLKISQKSLLLEDQQFDFKEAYSINTQLSLRFMMTREIGIIKGRGGVGDDITDLGFQFKNSMIGNSSLNINFFLHRRVCANGMIAPAGSAINRIFHSGKQENFSKRLEAAFKEITGRVGQAGKMIEQLGSLEFDSEQLARLNRSEMIFDIIQGSKSEIISQCQISKTSKDGNKNENKCLREEKIIKCVPKVYAGKYSGQVFNSEYRDNVSMFDFINIFTEYAKELNPAQKIATEEKAGVLADWIAKNKRKFKTAQVEE
jgi:hypothetical protein